MELVRGKASHRKLRLLAVACIWERGLVVQHEANRRFLAATGESPVAYLHRVRVDAAKQMLEGTRANVDEISRAVGYRDPRSFSRLFRRQTGLSPREYRNRFGLDGPR